MNTTKRIIIFTAISVLLAGCKPGPIYIGGAPQTAAVKDSQGNVKYVNYHLNKKRMVSVPPSTGSDLMTNKIRAAFAQDPILSQYPIEVSTHRGEVTLVGKVPDKNVKNYAIKMARYTKGVLMVHADNLIVASQ